MKLTPKQLRQIIAEEVRRVRLAEAPGDLGSAELQTMLDVVCDGWKSQFNPADPSMDAAGGKPAWEAQCDAACEDLGAKVAELVMSVESDLYDGVYGA